MAETSRDRFNQVYGRFLKQYEVADFRVAAVNESGTFRVLRASIRFSRNGGSESDQNDPKVLDYGSLLLVRGKTSPSEALNMINNATSGPTPLEFEGHRVIFDRFPAEYPVNGRDVDYPTPIGPARRTQWPSREFLFYFEPTSDGVRPPEQPTRPIVNSRLPPIVDPAQRIDEWVGFEVRRFSQQWRNSLLVILPDFRARVKSVTIAENDVHVDVEEMLANRSDLVFKAALGDGGRSVPLQDSEIKLDLGQPWFGVNIPASEVFFWILHRTSEEVLDWLDFSVGYPTPPPQIRFASAGLQLTQMIDQGESQTVEWKVKLGDDNDSKGEFFESIVAFANTNEGLVLVGVDKKGNIVGVEDPKKVRQAIEDLIESRCDPPVPGISFDEVTYEDKVVLMVTVPEGPDPPYLLRRQGGLSSKSELYIRRYDKDRPMRRSDLMEILKSRMK
jgi:hypothetical protein